MRAARSIIWSADRRALLLIHGLGSSGADWAWQVAELEHKFRSSSRIFREAVIATPLPGTCSISGLARALWSLCDQLGLDTINVVGFSLGGRGEFGNGAAAARRVPAWGSSTVSHLSARSLEQVDRSGVDTRPRSIDRHAPRRPPGGQTSFPDALADRAAGTCRRGGERGAASNYLLTGRAAARVDGDREAAPGQVKSLVIARKMISRRSRRSAHWRPP